LTYIDDTCDELRSISVNSGAVCTLNHSAWFCVQTVPKHSQIQVHSLDIKKKSFIHLMAVTLHTKSADIIY